ncbi:hypothetical protein QBC40DRAFT_352268 [Triangularia verruculosa]|uniref:Uncharacterized protein n=1 Tax=Triangularia verruculosa TaxID=2587418 RepID=A0AAN6X8U1_9PEZI|nr:hypothetical protein QBC40DRAFT_352268 [Triangularia verruculosa]
MVPAKKDGWTDKMRKRPTVFFRAVASRGSRCAAGELFPRESDLQLRVKYCLLRIFTNLNFSPLTTSPHNIIMAKTKKSNTKAKPAKEPKASQDKVTKPKAVESKEEKGKKAQAVQKALEQEQKAAKDASSSSESDSESDSDSSSSSDSDSDSDSESEEETTKPTTTNSSSPTKPSESALHSADFIALDSDESSSESDDDDDDKKDKPPRRNEKFRHKKPTQAPSAPHPSGLPRLERRRQKFIDTELRKIRMRHGVPVDDETPHPGVDKEFALWFEKFDVMWAKNAEKREQRKEAKKAQRVRAVAKRMEKKALKAAEREAKAEQKNENRKALGLPEKEIPKVMTKTEKKKVRKAALKAEGKTLSEEKKANKARKARKTAERKVAWKEAKKAKRAKKESKK